MPGVTAVACRNAVRNRQYRDGVEARDRVDVRRASVPAPSIPVPRRADSFGLMALVGAGTLGAHELGYLADPDGSVSHAYLDVLGPILVLLACVAAWSAAVRVLRGDPGRLPSVRILTAVQVTAYLVLEVGERLVDGSLSSLASTPVVLGLLAQPLVAALAVGLLRLGRHVVRSMRRTGRRALAPRRIRVPAPTASYVSTPALRRLRLRGPPV